ncbi:unnamed protein product [Paramecium sonneborni]|uniref:Uncharacterized protein n=1 Tax=Paramecium sonneborni TaxID=65129 RepID=A0A8S1RKQ1_9CILI|nr:unnamed protein product [Paramecium sonneborni]
MEEYLPQTYLSVFQAENLEKIFQKNENCGSSYTLLRIEAICQITNPNLTILIKRQFESEFES